MWTWQSYYVTIWNLNTGDPLARHLGVQPSCQEVPDLISWVQCFGIYATVVSVSHPDQILQLLAYQMMVVRKATRPSPPLQYVCCGTTHTKRWEHKGVIFPTEIQLCRPLDRLSSIYIIIHHSVMRQYLSIYLAN